MTEQEEIMIIRERVARGLAWIKANAEALNLDPARVDLATVNVINDHDCVVAQSGGRPFDDIMNDAGNPDLEDDGKWTTDHGFGPDLYEEVDLLADEWRRVLQAERGQVTAP